MKHLKLLILIFLYITILRPVLSAIYVAANNTIYVEGTNNGNPYRFEDIYQYLISNEYNYLITKITYSGMVQYIINGTIILQNGGWISDSNIILARDARYLAILGRTDPFILVNNSRLELYNVTVIIFANSGSDQSSFGWHLFYMAPNSTLTFINGIVYGYRGSRVFGFINVPVVSFAGSNITVRLEKVTIYSLKNVLRKISGDNITVYAKDINTYFLESLTQNPDFTLEEFSINLFSPTYYITLSSAFSGNVQGFTGRDSRTAAFYLFSFYGRVTIVNPDFDNLNRFWAGTASQCTGEIYINYTISGKVIDINGNPVYGANVTIMDNAGRTYTTFTNQTGDYLIVVTSYYIKGLGRTGLNNDTFVSFNPFKVIIDKYGYNRIEFDIVVDKPQNYLHVLVPKTATPFLYTQTTTFIYGEPISLFIQVTDENNKPYNVNVSVRVVNSKGDIIVDYVDMYNNGFGIYTITFDQTYKIFKPDLYFAIYKIVTPSGDVYYRVEPFKVIYGDFFANLKNVSTIILSHKDLTAFILVWLIVAILFSLYIRTGWVGAFILGFLILAVFLAYITLNATTDFDKAVVSVSYIIAGLILILTLYQRTW